MRKAKQLLRTTVGVVVATMLGLVPTALLAPPAHATSGTFIVVLKDGAAIGSAEPPGIVPEQVYTTALNGYAATMSDESAAALTSNPNVVSVEPDVEVRVADGTIAGGGVSAAAASTEIAPFGIVRIGALQSKTAKIDAKDERVDADVAVLDTGVDKTHADINFAGGVDCLPGDADEHPDRHGGYDGNGHGTLVAGVIGAIDNTFGVVGVAPGARIWSVKVLRKNNTGTLSSVLCGIDWVAAHAKTIDVANMSILALTAPTAGIAVSARVTSPPGALSRRAARCHDRGSRR